MILQKKNKIKSFTIISKSLRYFSYLFTFTFLCIFLANSLYFKDLNNQILGKINTLIFDNSNNAVSSFGDLITFFSGAARGTFSFITLPEFNLVINHQDISKIYSDKKNDQQNYVPARLEINNLVDSSALKAKVRAKGDRELHWEGHYFYVV